MSGEIFSILTFETENGSVVPNSPRTLEACLRSGIAPESLMPKALKEYKQNGIPLTRDGVARGGLLEDGILGRPRRERG